MAISIAVSIGGVTTSVIATATKEVFMMNSIALLACFGCGVALLWRPGGLLPLIEWQE